MIYPAIRKTLTNIIFFCFLGLSTYAQKTEINFNTYTTFFGFHGNGTTTESYINSNQMTQVDSTFNVYGKDGSFSYAIELQSQRITKRKMIYGIGIAFEKLNSKVNLDSVRQIVYGRQDVLSGKTFLRNSYITLNPFLGRRFIYSKMTLDFLLGLDVAFCEKSEEDVRAVFYNNSHRVSNIKTRPDIDYRPRVQMEGRYKRFGVLVGYSLGLTNYKQQSNMKAYSSLFRLGIGYVLK